MRVAQINAVYEYSSTGRNVQEMHHFLQKKFNSFVYCANYSDHSNQIFKTGNKLNYKIHAFLSRLFGLQSYFSYLSTRKLIKQLYRVSPNVVVLHNLHANYINLKLILKYLSRYDIPTVLVLHDCWFFTGHCCHYTEDKCYKWQTECKRCPALKKYNISWFFDRSNRLFKDKKHLFQAIPRLGVVGVSDWITNEAKKSILSKASVVTRIYNWIDFDIFYPRDVSIVKKKLFIRDEFIVLGVAQGWDEKKGLSRFITVAEHYPETKVILVGEIPKDCILLPNIIAVGTIHNIHQLAELYSLADIFLNFSIQETFGKAAAESLACGTPLVVNNATANPEIVGNCGIVVNNNNEKEIFDAIDLIRMRSKEYYREICIKRAKKFFSKEDNLMSYIDLFKDMQMIK